MLKLLFFAGVEACFLLKGNFCEDFKTESDTLINQSFCNSFCACREPVPVVVVVAQGRSGGTEAVDQGGQSNCPQTGSTLFTNTEDVLNDREMLAIAEHLYEGTAQVTLSMEEQRAILRANSAEVELESGDSGPPPMEDSVVKATEQV